MVLLASQVCDRLPQRLHLGPIATVEKHHLGCSGLSREVDQTNTEQLQMAQTPECLPRKQQDLSLDLQQSARGRRAEEAETGASLGTSSQLGESNR